MFEDSREVFPLTISSENNFELKNKFEYQPSGCRTSKETIIELPFGKTSFRASQAKVNLIKDNKQNINALVILNEGH